jgi:hypothetical protein
VKRVTADPTRATTPAKQLELSVADLRVKHVHAGRVDVDEHVALADRRLRDDLADLHRTLVLAD